MRIVQTIVELLDQIIPSLFTFPPLTAAVVMCLGLGVLLSRQHARHVGIRQVLLVCLPLLLPLGMLLSAALLECSTTACFALQPQGRWVHSAVLWSFAGLLALQVVGSVWIVFRARHVRVIACGVQLALLWVSLLAGSVVSRRIDGSWHFDYI